MSRRITKRQKEMFLSALRETGNVSASAKAAGVGRQTVYEVREREPRFAAAWDEVLNERLDEIEANLFERARTGESDTAAIFLLKSHRREIYGDRVRHEGKVEHDHFHVAVQATDLWIEEVLSEAEDRPLPEPLPN